ncbi:hypothetical protein Q5P01_026410 [Channa striata]|uniref:Uncharacterized protein n=1 Tax=Channa striata TaxID=64152 RepID=A0AA88LNR1_CHASR|nr:hypothetical protein Q5P01_026410 [Channa striata]
MVHAEGPENSERLSASALTPLCAKRLCAFFFQQLVPIGLSPAVEGVVWMNAAASSVDPSTSVWNSGVKEDGDYRRPSDPSDSARILNVHLWQTRRPEGTKPGLCDLDGSLKFWERREQRSSS